MADTKEVNPLDDIVEAIEKNDFSYILPITEDYPIEELRRWRHPILSLTIFQFAVVYGRTQIVQFLGDNYPFLILDMSPIEEKCLLNFPLHLAFMAGEPDTIKYLLEKMPSSYLSQVSYVSVTKNKSETEPCFLTKNKGDYSHGKPLDFAILYENMKCVLYFIKNIIPPTFQFLYVGIKEPMLCLFKACSFGLGPAVRLILKTTPIDVTNFRDRNGKTLLHNAVWNGDTETIGYLLEKGASVNETVEGKGCLNIMYRSKFNPLNFVSNTKLLLQNGLDLQKDRQGQTALFDLIEEFTYQCYKWNISKNNMSYLERESEDYNEEMHRQELIKCVEILLEEGVDSNETSGNVSPLQVFLRDNKVQFRIPELAYRVLELLLSHGANTDIMCSEKCKPQSLLTYFVLYNLQKMTEDKMKLKFIHLFSCYDNDITNRGGDTCYPLVAGLQKRMPLEVLELIVNLMEISHLQRAMKSIKERLLLQFVCSHFHEDRQYGEDIADLFQKCQLRSLQHCCKLVVRRQLEQPLKRVEGLPLPTYLKNYVTSASF